MDHIEVIARGVCVREGRVLACRNVRHGYAYLPGGHVEFGEACRTALARELVEETGESFTVGPCVLVSEGSFLSKRRHHEINLVFLVEQVGAEDIRSMEPEIEFEWLDLAALVDTDLRPDAVKAWLLSSHQSPGMEWASEIPSVD